MVVELKEKCKKCGFNLVKTTDFVYSVICPICNPKALQRQTITADLNKKIERCEKKKRKTILLN